MIIESQQLGPAQLPANFSVYDLIRHISERVSERIGTRTIDGVEAVGFRIVGPLIPEVPVSTAATVWVDPAIMLPVRIEAVHRADDDHDATVADVMTDFVFDGELDPALFSFEVPEGYEVRRIGVAELKPAPPEDEGEGPVLTAHVGLGPVRFGDSKDEILTAFGAPDREQNAGRSTILEYYSRGFSLTVGDEVGLVMIHCYTQHGFAFTVRDFAGRTAEGIAMGAGRAAIEAAYGEPASVSAPTVGDVLGDDARDPDEPTGQVNLSYPGRGLSFALWEERLYSIMAMRPR